MTICYTVAFLVICHVYIVMLLYSVLANKFLVLLSILLKQTVVC